MTNSLVAASNATLNLEGVSNGLKTAAIYSVIGPDFVGQD
jgi:hypothetical protein